jgi:DDE superfamily endonuclease
MFGEKVLFPKFVKVPQSLEALKQCENEYRIAGFPGCVGSTDATHIPLEKVSFTIRQGHLGFKTSATTRTYNLTVNHRRQILHTTSGHPGRWNDKTLARYDTFMDQLRRGFFDDMMTFELFDANGKRIVMKGAYVIVDNGYLQWSTSVPPFKDSCSRKEVRFSKWLESLRKDVECTFGILKSRWRILKTGIRLHNTEVADRVWVTCCALHNMLLDVDGLSKGWEHGVPSYWQDGGNGQFEVCDLPQAVRRLLNPNLSLFVDVDRSTFGYLGRPPAERTGEEGNNDYDDEYMMDAAEEPAGNDEVLQHLLVHNDERDVPLPPISVSSLSLKGFRSLLVENFDVLFHQEQIIWPSRLLLSKPRDVPRSSSCITNNTTH